MVLKIWYILYIDDVLGLEGLKDHEFINYKDRMLSIETVQQRIGG